METIQRLYPQFNAPVSTPRGDGYLVGKDNDGLLLVSVKQEPDKTHARCCHVWFKPDEVQFK